MGGDRKNLWENQNNYYLLLIAYYLLLITYYLLLITYYLLLITYYWVMGYVPQQ